MSFFFFFNDTATTEIYTLSLHDALPILSFAVIADAPWPVTRRYAKGAAAAEAATNSRDRKSTRLNSSHLVISYAVFCLKKKKTKAGALTSSALLRPLCTRAPWRRSDRPR